MDPTALKRHRCEGDHTSQCGAANAVAKLKETLQSEFTAQAAKIGKIEAKNELRVRSAARAAKLAKLEAKLIESRSEFAARKAQFANMKIKLEADSAARKAELAEIKARTDRLEAEFTASGMVIAQLQANRRDADRRLQNLAYALSDLEAYRLVPDKQPIFEEKCR